MKTYIIKSRSTTISQSRGKPSLLQAFSEMDTDGGKLGFERFAEERVTEQTLNLYRELYGA